MLAKVRKIIVINLIQEGPIAEADVLLGGIRFIIQEHRIGWDFDTAESLIGHFDGYVDGFSLSGIQKNLVAGSTRISHPGYLRLIRRSTRTPVYIADDIGDFFTEWTLQRMLREQPQIFSQKKVLFHCATASTSLQIIHEAGATVLAADPILFTGAPVILKGPKQIERFLNLMKPFVQVLALKAIKPLLNAQKAKPGRVLSEAIKSCDVFVGFGNMIPALGTLELLAGKLVLVDHLDPLLRKKLMDAGVAQVVEFIPEHPSFEGVSAKHFSVLAAVIDQTRVVEDSPLSLGDYLLQWFQKTGVSPNRLKSNRGIKRKCAFIIHPLSQKDIWKAKGGSIIEKSPEFVKSTVEKMAAKLPCFYYGSLRGVFSQATGQEVECDFYAMPATPKQLLSMNEEFVYQRLIDCAELAKKRGAGMIGLGAYTKVIGDAGVTVARRSPIPVTNGNSYSASTTLWAATQMVQRLGLISHEKLGNRYNAKAMVIGATGSIGRVSSLLLSYVFKELVLVANRADKLLELQEEIRKLNPEVVVKVTTQANTELLDTDLIVTATSNQTGNPILDIDLVKPGAVICDCSRPLDFGIEEAARRPDVMVIESGEVLLPGMPSLNVDIGLPKPSVYACTAETVLLALEGRFENFSLSKQLSMEKVKEIYKLGLKHGATLSAIQGPAGVITDDQIRLCRALAIERLKSWNLSKINHPGLTLSNHFKVGSYEQKLL